MKSKLYFLCKINQNRITPLIYFAGLSRRGWTSQKSMWQQILNLNLKHISVKDHQSATWLFWKCADVTGKLSSRLWTSGALPTKVDISCGNFSIFNTFVISPAHLSLKSIKITKKTRKAVFMFFSYGISFPLRLFFLTRAAVQPSSCVVLLSFFPFRPVEGFINWIWTKQIYEIE